MATVDHHHLDSVPVIDLCLLTQSELYSLSLSSSSSSAASRFDDDVFIPKIDRSVFNESAGSRKQTYSRLRLAPRNTSSSSASSNSKSRRPLSPPPLDRESRQIISLLKSLFPSENQNDVVNNVNDAVFVQTVTQYRSHAAPPLLPPSESETKHSLTASGAVSGSDSSLGKRKRGRPRKDANAVIAKPEAAISSDEAKDDNAGVFFEKRDGEATSSGTFVPNSTGQLVESCGEGKRRRGRPRKDEVRVRDESTVVVSAKKPPRVKKEMKEVDGEMVLVNVNDVVVDLDALANAADGVFEEELRKRTAGLEGEAELLGFLEGLEGEWSSARKKRRILQASELGDLLPKWWKIILALKRNGGHKSLMCRRFISPNGLEFMSCKEVSSYLHSYFGLGSQSNTVHTEGNIQSNKMVLGDGMQQDTITCEDNNNDHELLRCSPMPNTLMNSCVSSIKASGMGVRKKLDPIKSGRLGTSSKIQEPDEIHGEQTSDMIAKYDLSSDFALGKIDDIMAKYFGASNDDSNSMSCGEQAMKANKKICFSDGLNDGVRVGIISVDVPKRETDSASNDFGKEHGADNIDNHQSTNTVDDVKIDDVDNCRNGRSISGISESHNGPETAYSNVDQQSTSEACSLVPSIMVESLHESGLYSTATDGETCAVSNKLNNDSFPRFYEPRFDDIGLSGSNDKTFCFGGDHAMPDVDSMEISERVRITGSCSNVPPLDGQSCINNATNPGCTLEELLQEKSLASNTFNSFVNKGGIHTAEGHKVEHARNYDNSELSVNFGSRATGTNADTTSCIDEERSSKGYSLASYANEHASVSENSFIGNSILEELKPDRGTSETNLVCPSRYQQGYNLVNHANSISSSQIEVLKEEVKRSWSDDDGLAHPSGVLNDSQPFADSMSKLMWRNSAQDVQQSGLADTSTLMQSSSSYPNFDMLSDKGANGALRISEKFDNVPCLEGLEQFDCPTAQATSQSKESNVLSYDESIQQSLNSSTWPEKEALALVPNLEIRREINSCVWCKNEFHHDAYGAGMQTGSVGFMCANCQGKFSGHVSFL